MVTDKARLLTEWRYIGYRAQVKGLVSNKRKNNLFTRMGKKEAKVGMSAGRFVDMKGKR